MMSKEAIAHYEAALKEAFPRGATGEVFHHWNEARCLIATEALDKMAENARELGLDYEPAQEEPFGYFKAEPFGWTDCAESDEGAVALYERPQPAQRTWVGLTDVERRAVRNSVPYSQFMSAGEYAEHVQKATEFMLLEKNT